MAHTYIKSYQFILCFYNVHFLIAETYKRKKKIAYNYSSRYSIWIDEFIVTDSYDMGQE